MNLTRPTFIIDEKKSKDKISKMFDKASKQGLRLRPHFKTHQNHEVGSWFRDIGVREITVSSFEMAEFFEADGWKDITVAFSVNINEIDRINALAGKINLNIVLEDISIIDYLENNLSEKVGVYVEINTGYNRAGLNPQDFDTITPLLQKLGSAQKLKLKGFLTFAGHSYHATGEEEILEVHRQTTGDMLGLKKKYSKDYPSLEISIGDTPTCTVAQDFSGIDEMRPGNFVFCDQMQVLIGSYKRDGVSAIVACPIVAIHRERQEIIIFGGAVHFSKEMISRPEGETYYGEVVELNEEGWKQEETGAYLSWMTQEHGIVKATESFMDKFKIGDFIGVIPAHSCLAANLMKNSTLIINKETVEKIEN